MNALWLLVAAAWVADPPPDWPALPPALAAAVQPLQEAVLQGSANSAANSAANSSANGAAYGSAWGELAMFYQAHEFLIDADEAYQRARAADAHNPQWWYLSGVVAQLQGNTIDAEAHFSRALGLAPRSEPAAVMLARIKRRRGESVAARTLLDAVLSQQNSAAAHAELGQLALADEQWLIAADHLQTALELQPAARTLYYPLASALRNSGQLDRARQALAQGGQGTPRLDDPWMQRMQRQSRSAAFYMSQGLAAARSADFAAALDLMQRAAEAEPENVLVLVNLARAHENMAQWPLAEATLRRALLVAPDHAAAHFNLGVLDELAGRDPDALAHYNDAIDRDPNLFQAQLLAANAALRLGQTTVAAARYAAALALRPERDELRFREVVALTARQCVAAVGKALELVRRLPEDPDVLTLYIRVVATCPAASAPDRRNALNAARNLHRLQPDWPVLESRAMAEGAAGHFQSAVMLQEQVLSMVGDDAEPWMLEVLGERLTRYQAGQLAARPFATNPQLTRPRPLTATDRR